MSESCREYMPRSVEWGTLSLMIGCYAVWLAALWLLPEISLLLAIAVMGLIAALHSSLTHEALHGHPFRSQFLNEAMMFLPLTLFIPYGRFRDTHLDHHRDELLTDPYDDPEANFQDPAVWARLPGWRKRLLRLNNTMLGRVLIGPVMGQICFMADEWKLARSGKAGIVRDWVLHVLGLVPVIWLIVQSPAPLWAAILAAYIGLALIKVRTFLEHRAHEDCRGRTVVVEDKGFWALLFLNNNYHIVHHMHPGVPWYALPRLYQARKPEFVAANDGYVYRNYLQIFRNYLFRAKDPVPHPLWQQGE